MQQSLPIPRQVSSPAPRRINWPGLRWFGLPLALFGVLSLWQLIVTLGGYRPFILPGPLLVAERFVATAQSGILWQHTSVTLIEALGGFSIALVVALIVGYLLAHLPWLERAVAPLLAASQAIPVIAVAPLIILWFGPGLTGKLLIAALITFLPILIATVVALRGIPRELREMALISGANRWQMLRYVEAPLSVPVLFGGIRTGLALATTGAVVGEFVAGREGLGALINIARGLFDTPLIFVALITLAAMTLSFYLAATLIEKALMRWDQ
ncbi:MAG: ABC transporter permease [Oscillochloridaceae bacterium umkhey_bin13]